MNNAGRRPSAGQDAERRSRCAVTGQVREHARQQLEHERRRDQDHSHLVGLVGAHPSQIGAALHQ
jgi:hypothetical protein